MKETVNKVLNGCSSKLYSFNKNQIYKKIPPPVNRSKN